jgi:hypothetical protein
MSRSTRLASAGIVAAAVLAIAACGTSSSSAGVAGATGTPATSAAPVSEAPASVASPSAEASAAASAPALNQAFLQFQEQNDSGITGGAILTDLGDNQTAVTLGVVAAGVVDPMPANVVPSDCAGAATASPPPASSPAASAAASPAASGPAAALDPTTILRLGDLTAGSSNTVLALNLDGLTSTPHAIVIYRSAADPTIVACADITQ